MLTEGLKNSLLRYSVDPMSTVPRDSRATEDSDIRRILFLHLKDGDFEARYLVKQEPLLTTTRDLRFLRPVTESFCSLARFPVACPTVVTYSHTTIS